MVARALSPVPSTVTVPRVRAGYREACTVAHQRLQAAASNSSDEASFKRDLLNIARTTLSSKILTHDKDHFAELAVDAVLRLQGSTNLDSIHLIKKTGGTLRVRRRGRLRLRWAPRPACPPRCAQQPQGGPCIWCAASTSPAATGFSTQCSTLPPCACYAAEGATAQALPWPARGSVQESFLDEGFILDKRIGIGQPTAAGERQDPGGQHCHGH